MRLRDKMYQVHGIAVSGLGLGACGLGLHNVTETQRCTRSVVSLPQAPPNFLHFDDVVFRVRIHH